MPTPRKNDSESVRLRRIEAPCPALAELKRDRESSKCKEVILFYCSSLANPAARLVDELKSCRASRVVTGNALAVAFS
jgi:hypothetical protein